ncbi:hypothetical protein [Anabaena sp. CCY 9402-a]|uniref:hypothetical protein n=1 Tax=Anabaena sp. CCY 9402-a TaxID=3103867 RepID=UPI0039C5D2F9
MTTQLHAPGHIREAFLHWLDECVNYPQSIDDVFDLDGEEFSSKLIVEMLSECNDILPGAYCSQLDIPQGSTYALACKDIQNWFDRVR